MLFAPRKEPFFDTKSKCGPNSRPKVPLARINTGGPALFALGKIRTASGQPSRQKRGTCYQLGVVVFSSFWHGTAFSDSTDRLGARARVDLGRNAPVLIPSQLRTVPG